MKASSLDNDIGQVDTDLIEDERMCEIISFPALVGSALITDYYTKICPGQYRKVLHKGRIFIKKDLEAIAAEGKDRIYFRSEERVNFLTHMNGLVEKNASENRWSVQTKCRSVKDVLESFYQQLRLEGMRHSIIEEGMRCSVNIITMLERDGRIRENLRFLSDESKSESTHHFLVALFSSAISKNVEWSSPRTTEYTVMGALFHDIGMQQLPENLQHKPLREYSPGELVLYESHPIIGADMARQSRLPEPVAQIILQHHEFHDGSGFPYHLSNKKVYPLAKITGLADYFVTFMSENNLTAIDALRAFVPERSHTDKFDPDVIRALIKCFLKGK